jgi:hypothetical protein
MNNTPIQDTSRRKRHHHRRQGFDRLTADRQPKGDHRHAKDRVGQSPEPSELDHLAKRTLSSLGSCFLMSGYIHQKLRFLQYEEAELRERAVTVSKRATDIRVGCIRTIQEVVRRSNRQGVTGQAAIHQPVFFIRRRQAVS